ncbi:ER membrane protein complex subunit 7-like [Schistocerca gregaria]|uniref:ER membrane protein complex subunit 7-like n=1 Tax=Schistocerca gregaria TaxID=7010 RepID=UPI00211E54E2|nr:ER membrane protein complex subunit 7-like [Schistocerca gregaria]
MLKDRIVGISVLVLFWTCCAVEARECLDRGDVDGRLSFDVDQAGEVGEAWKHRFESTRAYLVNGEERWESLISNGSFSFRGVCAGEYQLQIQSAYYEFSPVQVIVTGDRHARSEDFAGVSGVIKPRRQLRYDRPELSATIALKSVLSSPLILMMPIGIGVIMLNYLSPEIMQEIHTNAGQDGRSKSSKLSRNRLPKLLFLDDAESRSIFSVERS